MKITQYDMATSKGEAIPVPSREVRKPPESDCDALWRVFLLQQAIASVGTQRAVASPLGVTEVTVSRWLRGRMPIAMKHVSKLACLV